MEITYTDRIAVDDYNLLRASAGWPQICPEQAQAGLNGSVFMTVAKDGAKTVGMARLVTDGGYIAYIADVLVLPEYQRRYIGTELMNRVMANVRERRKDGYQIHLVLMSAKGKESFYKQFGFVKRPDDHFGCRMSQWLSE
ncbi:MAG: GNAT family N-acetyltransferase [Oscillospiraceae bacterium]